MLDIDIDELEPTLARGLGDGPASSRHFFKSPAPIIADVGFHGSSLLTFRFAAQVNISYPQVESGCLAYWSAPAASSSGGVVGSRVIQLVQLTSSLLISDMPPLTGQRRYSSCALS